MAVFGSLLFAFLMIVRVEQMTRSGFDLLLFLLAKQAGLAAIRMIFRQPALKETHLAFQVLAWCSAMLPLLMQTVKGLHGLLAVPGLLLSLWAMLSLGSSFSIAPAVRQLVAHGPYRWIRHPMYAGEILSLVGACFVSLSLWNVVVLLLFIATVYLRVMKEESLFLKYSFYAQFVRWRMVPGVW